MIVMLKRDWGGPFRRSVYDSQGNRVKTLVFNPGEPVELAEDELAAVKSDIGPALVQTGVSPVQAIVEKPQEPVVPAVPVKEHKRGKNS